MASSAPSPATSLRVLFFFLLIVTFASGEAGDYGLHPRTEKTTHLQLYFHELNFGPDATVIRVAQAPTTDKFVTAFGAVNIVDDMMKAGPDTTSRLVGRFQGVFVPASQTEFAALAMANVVFVDGTYNGSSLTILGRNSIFATVREMPIVGGSGHFRLARGYALLKTRVNDPNTGLVIVQYNVTVVHY
ncbi:hypothetical protein Taro_047724 [Colocasia esculenta]|uniref:Dirigent protein n=1 Tax=Colocasia esculenta TaxID=4460 RepID=A0A843X488_COLES|nr:hypothetical protein [Colocasia esculenta]